MANITPNLKLINADCITQMKLYNDNEFNIAFTDPPYNVGREYNEYDDNKKESIYYEWCDNWFKELQRISETQVLTIGYKNLKYWINKDPRHMIIWHKPNQNSPSPIGGFNAYEVILYFGKLQKRIGHDIFKANIKMQQDADFHDCPKHLDTWKYILSQIAKPKSKVIDIFSGSGTTLMACNDLGLECVAIEKDNFYYNKALSRVKEYCKILTFDF